MAETFSNATARAIGVTTTNATATIGVATDYIKNISTFNASVGMIVDHPNFIGGTRITKIDTASNFGTSGEVIVDSTSTNTTGLGTQSVGFHTVTAIDTASQKSILVGGTLSNNTNSPINVNVMLQQSGNESINIVNNAPIPVGSSLIISDAGKVVVGVGSTLAVATDANDSLDVSLSLLTGVS